MMMYTIMFQLQLMLIVSYYKMILVKINKGDKFPLHVLKNTTEVMIILQNLMGHMPCPLYHKATPLW